MEEETKKVDTGSEVEHNADENYLATIKELKENTVSKEAFDKVMKENKILLDSYVNGVPSQAQAPKKDEGPSLDQLRVAAFNTDQTNLQFVSNALAFRKKMIEEKGIDPFVPLGSKYIPTEEDVAAAQRVADVYQQCIDASDGDSAVFTALLQKRTVDATLGMTKKKR